MTLALCIALFLPLAGFVAIMFGSRILSRRVVEYIACSAVCISFLSFVYIALQESKGLTLESQVDLFPWIPVEGINANFSLHLDHLSMLMGLLITGIGFLIHVYSRGYMDHEEDYARYFACLNFFIFSMLLLVLAADLIVLFVGWEGVGLASYLLIGFWYTKPQAANAAKKAFIVNRIGDVGLLLGILLTLYLFGTCNIATVISQAQSSFAVGAPLLTLLTALYFWGATGKSAQLPLHVWLPDAMEGPTPVSALIHAATMVNAGVYLVVRMSPVFTYAPETLAWIGYIGAATSLFAALCAIGQIDLKRVLAYSTVSQLGLMFLACGAGSFYAATFHLTMHAFVKALLFLSAGNVVHMMHGTTELAKMGALRFKLQKTHVVFLIGVLSMSGIPPLAIFFSKDLILEEEFLTGHNALYFIGLSISVLTAFYLTRAYLLTFTGSSRLDLKEYKSIKEAPSVMLRPVYVLAVLAAVGGFIGLSLNGMSPLMRYIENHGIGCNALELQAEFHLSFEMWLSIIAAFTGLIASYFIYSRVSSGIGSVCTILLDSFYVNELYHVILGKPYIWISQVISAIFERIIFDECLTGIGAGTTKTAALLQRVQSGQIRSYISWMVIGASILLLYFTFGGF